MLNVEIQSDTNTNTNTVDTGWSMRVGATWWSHYHKWLTVPASPPLQIQIQIQIQIQSDKNTNTNTTTVDTGWSM